MKRRLSFGLALCFGAALGCGDDTGSDNTTADAGADGGGVSSSGSSNSTSSSGSASGTSSTGTTSSTRPDDSGDPTSSEADAGDGGDEPTTGDAGDADIDIVWGDGGSLSISSPNFDYGDPLPEKYTCEGNEFGSGVSPQLEWSGPAPGTKRYALAFVDLTVLEGPVPARAYHWLAYDIPLSVTGIPEELGGNPQPVELAGGTQVRGGPPQEDQNFFGPCPSWPLAVCPEGLVERSTDSYNFILYTFDDDSLEYPEAAAEGKSYAQTLVEFFEENATERAVLAATSDAASTTAPAPCPVELPSDGGADAGDAGDLSTDDAGDLSTDDAGDLSTDDAGADAGSTDAGDAG
jgi:phosphatidylethanolamine-binding protein (PEBP) family uncharacterized protein